MLVGFWIGYIYKRANQLTKLGPKVVMDSSDRVLIYHTTFNYIFIVYIYKYDCSEIVMIVMKYAKL